MPLSKITTASISTAAATANTNIDNGTFFVDVTNNRVGVGSTTPQSPLEVFGLIRTTGFVSNPTSGAGMEMAYDGTQGILQAYSDRAAQTPVPVYLVTGQLRFPATQLASVDPNTLDDYEEGTWTPTCFHESSNNSTWAYKVGYYLKIGGILHCWWTNDSGNSGTAGSALKVSGLPFTASSANLPYGVGGVWGSNGATLTGNHFINAGSALVQLYRGGNDYTTQQSFVSGYFTFRVA